jgi:hypothetical protein
MKAAVIMTVVAMGILLSLAGVPVNAQQAPALILRDNIASAYIANQTINVQLQGTYAAIINGKPIPQAASLLYTMEITSLNGTLIEEGNISQPNGILFSYYFTGIAAGVYDFSASYSVNGFSTSVRDVEFLVLPPPVPYVAYWSGSTFIFHSSEYNLTGAYNSSYPFTVTVVYEYPNGGGAEVQGVYQTTNFTFIPPDEGQLVSISIQDVWGWQNSNHISLASFQFGGAPYQYDYGPAPQPLASSLFVNIVADVLLILIVGVILLILAVKAGKPKGRRYY